VWRVGLLGCGAFARLYHVPVLTTDPRVRLVAVCDPAPGEETRRLAGAAGAALLSEADALWPACEAVVISTPHALHAAHVRAALEHARHVLVDKPFVLATAEARELAAAAATRGLVNAVALTRRFDPGSGRARALVQAGALGAIRYVETVQLGYPATGWVADPALGGGGPFIGRGAHMADLIPWLVGRPPGRIRARVHPGEAGRVDRGGFIAADFGAFVCHMTALAEGLHMWDEIRVFGDDGLVELRRPLGQPLGWALAHLGPTGAVRETVAAEPAVGAATRDFLDALDGHAPAACPFREAVLSVRTIEAAYQSAAAGGTWIDL
jgi:predicted dehydrogenase